MSTSVCVCVASQGVNVFVCLSLSLRCSGGVYSAAHMRGRDSSNLTSPACSPLSRSPSSSITGILLWTGPEYHPSTGGTDPVCCLFFHKHCLRILGKRNMPLWITQILPKKKDAALLGGRRERRRDDTPLPHTWLCFFESLMLFFHVPLEGFVDVGWCLVESEEYFWDCCVIFFFFHLSWNLFL